jgi:centromeric protein E
MQPFPDKVFGPSCQTDLVYEGGAKDVAMSALTGINGGLVLTL